jgi:hypothetical protein
MAIAATAPPVSGKFPVEEAPLESSGALGEELWETADTEGDGVTVEDDVEDTEDDVKEDMEDDVKEDMEADVEEDAEGRVLDDDEVEEIRVRLVDGAVELWSKVEVMVMVTGPVKTAPVNVDTSSLSLIATALGLRKGRRFRIMPRAAGECRARLSSSIGKEWL